MYIKIPCNFDDLQNIVGDYLSDSSKEKLKKDISNIVELLIVEFPYVDKDFRDTFYNDFSKRHELISRDSVRVHFFEKEEVLQKYYLGFITLRETSINNLGRSYLSPRAILNYPKGYYCLAEYQVELKGNIFTVKAFPWMQQDIDVTVCAHVATWAILRYFSEKYTGYPEKTLYEITKFHKNSSRKIPASGLTIEQISQILIEVGFAPEIYSKATAKQYKDDKSEIEDDLFKRLLYIFIESGIPCIAGISEQRHAIVLIGHCKIPPINNIILKKGIIDSSELVNSLIINDDGQLPYKCIKNKNVACYDQPFNIDNIDSVIVPYYEKMYVDAKQIIDFLLIELEETLKFDENLSIIRRVLLTSSKSYKKFIKQKSRDLVYREDQLSMRLPKFIWLVEYAPYEQYYNGEINYRVVIDATLLQTKKTFLRIKMKNKLIDPMKASVEKKDNIDKLTKEFEPMYKNNLQEAL